VFLFEQMFNTALNGIVSAGLMSTILTVAYGILLASLLFAAYESWARGGDVRSLGVAAVKYLAIGILLNGGGAIYDSVFRAILQAFNQMAHTMAGVGPSDVFGAWITELRNAGLNSATLLNVITGAVAGILSALLLLIAMIMYPVAYMVFAILYSLYGAILYVTGPLVLALMPSIGLGTLARRYATNLMVFAAWGLIYGILCRLTLALNINSMAAITGAGNFAGALTGASAEVLLAAASILFSVCILLIPFLAKRIVEGDLGGTMMMVLGAANSLVQSTVSAVAGSAGGFGKGTAGMGESAASSPSSSGGNTSVGGGAGAGSGGSGSGVTGGAKAPTGPGGGGGGRGMGDFRPVNVPHAIGWLAGAAAAAGVQGGKSVLSAGRNLISKNQANSGGGNPAPPAKPSGDLNPVDEWV
jgi:hypothetical protein